MSELPPHFCNTIESVFGDRGRIWLEQLPLLLEGCARRWSLQIGPPFNLSYNYVAPARLEDGSEVVLKLGVPNRELNTEIAALEVYAGRGSVRLIDADPEQGFMLLELLSPGTMLSAVEDDEQATRIAAGVFRELRHAPPPSHSFPTVADWAKGMQRLRTHYDGGTGPFPTRLVEEAETLFAELLASQSPPVLLHGDLHHFNILLQDDPATAHGALTPVPSPACGRGVPGRPITRPGDRVGTWLAIDPKGVVGEAEYEVGALLRNPHPELLARPEAVLLQKRRIETLAEELGHDRTRLRNWAVAQAVLSGWWGVEDGGEVDEEWIACCERLAEVRF